MKAYLTNKLSLILIVPIFYTMMYFSSSCAKPANNARPIIDSNNTIVASFYPDTISFLSYANTRAKYVYVYDIEKRLKSIDIYEPITNNANDFIFKYQFLYEYSNGSNLPAKRYYYEILDSPYPAYTSFLQYDGNDRKIYDSCREWIYGNYTIASFIYPDTSHIVVHQTIKNGPLYKYLTDTIFLHNSSQIDSIRKYNDIDNSAPSTYFYSQYININDTMPNMFYKLSIRQADLYAPHPGEPASFNISLFNSFNRLLFKSYTDNISTDNSVYFWPYLFYPNKAPELLYETYDSSGYFTRNHYLFNYKH